MYVCMVSLISDFHVCHVREPREKEINWAIEEEEEVEKEERERKKVEESISGRSNE